MHFYHNKMEHFEVLNYFVEWKLRQFEWSHTQWQQISIYFFLGCRWLTCENVCIRLSIETLNYIMNQ